MQMCSNSESAAGMFQPQRYCAEAELPATSCFILIFFSFSQETFCMKRQNKHCSRKRAAVADGTKYT